ncbi:cation:proton antiporter, partial [Enterococcus faecium]
MSGMSQLIVAPILLPLIRSAMMLLLGEKHKHIKASLNLLSTFTGLAIAVSLLLWVRTQGQAASIGVYLPGNWPAQFGIGLVVDHLSALLLSLTGVIGFSAL